MEYKQLQVNGLRISYLEAGDPGKPTILLLQGFPGSAFLFRDLMQHLADRYHLVAPDYTGYEGQRLLNAKPHNRTLDYLARLVEYFVEALGLQKMSIYLLNSSLSVGLRVASHRPEWINALIVQNGLGCFDELEALPSTRQPLPPDNTGYAATNACPDASVLPCPVAPPYGCNRLVSKLYLIGNGEFVLEEDYLALSWLVDEFLTQRIDREQALATPNGPATRSVTVVC
jgi:pimeloyl-ACP methyl ester carboxylesterase